MAQTSKNTNLGTYSTDVTTQTALQTSKMVLDEAYRVLSETQHQVRIRESKPSASR